MADGKPGPRPTVTPEAQRVLLGALKVGHSLREAMVLAGVSRASVRRAVAADPDGFGQSVKKATLAGKNHHLRKIYRGEPGWQPSGWMLERKWWKEFAQRKPDCFTGREVSAIVLALVERVVALVPAE